MKRVLATTVALLALTLGTSAATARTDSRWPAVQEHAFLVNCYTTSGGRVAACKCELHWLERRYTYRQIAAIYLYHPTQLHRIILRAALACIR